LDDRAAAVRAERSRGTDRFPLPRTRRAPRHGPARTRRDGAVPGARRRGASGRRPRARRRRPGQRDGRRAAALPAGPPARTDRGQHGRDRLLRARRRGVRVHLRLAPRNEENAMTRSIPWEKVTDADVVRAIGEYDRLGPEGFFSEHGFAPTTT